jgi:NAD(P)H-dependent FMN reductase
MKLHTVIVSTRPGRIGPIIAKWFHETARTHGKFEAELVDLADFNLPIFNEPKHPRLREYQHDHTKKWSASVAAADAFAFVIPEYNYNPPPSFVNALDYVVQEWAYKPCGFISYGGVSGGLRSAHTARLLTTSLRMMPIPEGVPMPMVAQLIGEDKVFKPNDLISTGAKTMLDELAKWAGALKTLRA